MFVSVNWLVPSVHLRLCFASRPPQVDMSELAAKKASNGSETAETCESSFTDGLLYIYMALALLVCFPIAGHVFDKLMVAYKQCIVLIILYVVTGFLVVVIPLASTQWQFNLVAVGIGVSRTPDVLHPAFLLSILGEDLYPYAWALLLCLSAIVDGAAPPIVGKGFVYSVHYANV